MILLVSRAERFSPNSVDKDRAILQAVEQRLSERGMSVMTIHEDDVGAYPCGRPRSHITDNLILSMARSERALTILRRYEREGLTIINSTAGVTFCTKRMYVGVGATLNCIDDHKAYWLKRTDRTAQSRDDVCYAKDADEAKRLLESFHRRGIRDVQITEHVEGDVVKFYGVLGTSFFRTYYPTDDGMTKFDNEDINGRTHHYSYSIEALHDEADRIARQADVCIYGGDCIVKSDGSVVIIDFNDWPSFSRCKDEAAETIANIVGAYPCGRPQKR